MGKLTLHAQKNWATYTLHVHELLGLENPEIWSSVVVGSAVI